MSPLNFKVTEIIKLKYLFNHVPNYQSIHKHWWLILSNIIKNWHLLKENNRGRKWKENKVGIDDKRKPRQRTGNKDGRTERIARQQGDTEAFLFLPSFFSFFLCFFLYFFFLPFLSFLLSFFYPFFLFDKR